MHITFVKKIKEDGSACRKCAEVQKKLEDSGQIGRIDEIIIADERDPGSTGMQLAAKYGVDTAPFFIVREADGSERVYTIYFKFAKEVLDRQESAVDEAKELLDRNPGLDFL
ncbi:MAG: hypothetical protein U1F34_04480 [Gammaproteobacteria bacterium]